MITEPDDDDDDEMMMKITRFVIVRAELLGLEIRPECGAQLARVGEMIKVATREPEFEMSRNLSFSTSILSSDKDGESYLILCPTESRVQCLTRPWTTLGLTSW